MKKDITKKYMKKKKKSKKYCKKKYILQKNHEKKKYILKVPRTRCTQNNYTITKIFVNRSILNAAF